MSRFAAVSIVLAGLALLAGPAAGQPPPGSAPATVSERLAEGASTGPGTWRLVQAESAVPGIPADEFHGPAKPPAAKPLFGEPEPPDDDDGDGKPDWPNVSDPGPDLGDFPNSAYTLPRGKVYIEFAPFTLAGPDAQNPSSYITPFLLRYGVTDDVEFRIFGSGYTHIFGSNDQDGFSPISLDTKIHLWDQNNDWLVPAVSFEAYLQTNWGTKSFSGGWQESIALNFDMLLTSKTNLEWTIGYSGVQDAVNVITGERFIPRHHVLQPVIHRMNLNVNQLSIQWALEHELTEKLEVFYHGFFNGGILIQQGAGITMGVGAFWKFSNRLMSFGSINAGLTKADPPVLAQLGFAYAL